MISIHLKKKTNNKSKALKQFFPNMMDLFFDKQIEILRKVESPYIIKYLDHFSEETQFGDVHSILSNYYQVFESD